MHSINIIPHKKNDPARGGSAGIIISAGIRSLVTRGVLGYLVLQYAKGTSILLPYSGTWYYRISGETSSLTECATDQLKSVSPEKPKSSSKFAFHDKFTNEIKCSIIVIFHISQMTTLLNIYIYFVIFLLRKNLYW